MIKKLDFETFKDKLCSWSNKLKPFIESEKMWDIFQTLKKDNFEEGIVPKSSDTFRAFSTTLIHEVKVIFYLMDPYARLYKGTDIMQATGIAMDCSNSPDGKLQPSLDIFYDAVKDTLGKVVDRSPSLEYLHEQGVMMLNSDLTCKLNKTSSHEGLWLPFQRYLLEDVLGSDSHIIYVLCGEASHKLEKYISPFNKIFKLEHPAAAARKNRDWNYEDIFNKINNILADNNQREIFWNKADWEFYKAPPF